MECVFLKLTMSVEENLSLCMHLFSSNGSEEMSYRKTQCRFKQLSNNSSKADKICELIS